MYLNKYIKILLKNLLININVLLLLETEKIFSSKAPSLYRLQKIRAPISKKSLLIPKSYVNFPITTNISGANPCNSELVYNTNKLSCMLTTEQFRLYFSSTFFPNISDIYNTAGQNIFSDEFDYNKFGIPLEYIMPPITVVSNHFRVGLAADKDKTFTVVVLQKPLNITLDTALPISWVFNTKQLYNQYEMIILLMARLPIFFYYQQHIYGTNFLNLFERPNYFLKYFIPRENDMNAIKPLLLRCFLEPNNNIYTDGNRNYDPVEYTNRYYKKLYSDGQFHGFVSPQANDFYQSNDQNLVSDFNNVSPLKCLFQIAMLASAYNTTKNYTLENGCMIVYYNESNRSFNWTGKYWKKNLNDYGITYEVYQACFNRIKNDPTLLNKINREIGLDLTNVNFGQNDVLITVSTELGNVNLQDNLYDRIYFAKNLYKCIIGLEDYDKINFALFISGLIGNQWDKCLSYFKFQNYANMEREFNVFKVSQPNFNFVQHFGTMLAKYIYEYKHSQDTRELGQYNAVNFSRLISNKIMSIRDNIKFNTIYYPQKEDSILFPIVYGNLSLEIKTTCYRSFKDLLNYMKTRKQRDFMFDHLTHFGRRAMTILDPYGIFMHFQDDKRGLVSQD